MFSLLGRGARLTFTAASFAGFFVGGLLLSWLVLPLLSLTSRDPQRRLARCRRAVAGGFALLLAFMRLGRLIAHDPGQFRLPKGGPRVIIANHPTLIDVVAIVAANPQLCYVAKGNLFQLFFLRPLLRSCWHIEGGSAQTPSNTQALMTAAGERLDAGQSVLIFPEGTRSPEGGLGDFKRGAFEIAARNDVPVVPLFITMEPCILSKRAPWYRIPTERPRFEARPLPAMAPARWHGDSRRMVRHAQEAYAYCMDTGSTEGWTWPKDPEALQELVA